MAAKSFTGLPTHEFRSWRGAKCINQLDKSSFLSASWCKFSAAGWDLISRARAHQKFLSRTLSVFNNSRTALFNDFYD